MNRRLELHEVLCDILETRNVYFQPPSNLKLIYPCIVYSLSDIHVLYANNFQYSGREKWKITHISKEPNSSVKREILKLPFCSFDTAYTADNLNHEVLNLFF